MVDAKATVVLLETIAAVFLILLPYIIWSRLRFSLLRFFWKKDNFKSIVDVLFSSIFFELILALWLGLIFTVHNFLGFNIFTPLAQKASLFLIFIMLFISYIVEVEFYIRVFGHKEAKLYISPIKEIGFAKSDSKYILYLNGVKVVSSTQKDDLREFVIKIKDYLKPSIREDFEKFLVII